MYKRNPLYREAVEKNPLAMLPLFEPEQFGLDPVPKVINDATETKAEALKVLEKHLAKQQWVVYLAFKSYGPATDLEIHHKTGIEKTSVIGRRNELMKFGLIERYEVIKVMRNGRLVPNTRWKAVIRIPATLINNHR